MESNVDNVQGCSVGKLKTLPQKLPRMSKDVSMTAKIDVNCYSSWSAELYSTVYIVLLKVALVACASLVLALCCKRYACVDLHMVELM